MDGVRDPNTQAQVDAQRAARAYDRSTTGLMSDGKSVIFVAAYTEMNNRQLARPRVEIENYCRAAGGAFKALYLEKGNFVASAFQNPHTAFNDAMRRNYDGSLTMSVGFASVTHSMNSMKPLIAQAEAEQVATTNHALDRRGAEQGYLAAANSGAFGTFACIAANGNMLWKTTVLPFSYSYRDPQNQLTSHQLKIIMIPDKA